jgi:dTDP-4-dehydrorhamnose reductase
MNIVLTGCDGQLGQALRCVLPALGRLTALDRQACDLADASGLRNCLERLTPEVIVNAAAYTQVDRAETERAAAQAVNARAPGILGEVAARLGALVVHYSTDYVFDGTTSRPYRETDAPNPINVYGASKLAGERALTASGARCLILRTAWVFGARGGNFVRTILRLAAERETLRVVCDQFGTPTSSAFLAEATRKILLCYQQRPDAFPFGLYHLTAAGRTNWHDYAAHIITAARRAGMPLALAQDGQVPIPSQEYPCPAARPPNSQQDSRLATQTFALAPPPWQEDLEQVLKTVLRTAPDADGA